MSASSGTLLALHCCACVLVPETCSACLLVPSCSALLHSVFCFVQLYSQYAPYEYMAYWFEVWQSYEALVGCRSVSIYCCLLCAAAGCSNAPAQLSMPLCSFDLADPSLYGVCTGEWQLLGAGLHLWAALCTLTAYLACRQQHAQAGQVQVPIED